MPYDPKEDQKLTDFALGEIDQEHRDEVEDMIASNEDARKQVELIQSLAGDLSKQLQEEQGPSLSADQRDEIYARIDDRYAPVHDGWQIASFLPLATAAAIALGVSLFLFIGHESDSGNSRTVATHEFGDPEHKPPSPLRNTESDEDEVDMDDLQAQSRSRDDNHAGLRKELKRSTDAKSASTKLDKKSESARANFVKRAAGSAMRKAAGGKLPDPKADPLSPKKHLVRDQQDKKPQAQAKKRDLTKALPGKPEPSSVATSPSPSPLSAKSLKTAGSKGNESSNQLRRSQPAVRTLASFAHLLRKSESKPSQMNHLAKDHSSDKKGTELQHNIGKQGVKKPVPEKRRATPAKSDPDKGAFRSRSNQPVRRGHHEGKKKGGTSASQSIEDAKTLRRPDSGKADSRVESINVPQQITFKGIRPLSPFQKIGKNSSHIPLLIVPTGNLELITSLIRRGRKPHPNQIDVVSLINAVNLPRVSQAESSSPIRVDSEMLLSPWSPTNRLVRITLSDNHLAQPIQKLSIFVKINPRFVKSYRVIGFERHPNIEEFRRKLAAIPESALISHSLDTVTLLYEVIPTNSDAVAYGKVSNNNGIKGNANHGGNKRSGLSNHATAWLSVRTSYHSDQSGALAHHIHHDAQPVQSTSTATRLAVAAASIGHVLKSDKPLPADLDPVIHLLNTINFENNAPTGFYVYDKPSTPRKLKLLSLVNEIRSLLSKEKSK